MRRTFGYAATTKDAAQRSLRTFYEVVNIEKLKIIIRSLVAQEPLDDIHRDHKLIGNWKGRRECHIESDWLLIYLAESDRVVFERTGSHADLFQK